MKLEPQDFEIIQPMIKKSIQEAFAEWEKNDFERKIFNITQTGELLGKTYNWVSARMKDGTIKTTIDGMHVTGKEINRYLGEND